MIIGVDQLDAGLRPAEGEAETQAVLRGGASKTCSYPCSSPKFHAKRSENQDNGEAPEKAAV